MKASVGCCDLSRMGSTIGNVLGFDGLQFNEDRVAYFETLVKHRIGLLVTGNLSADDIRVFVKPEPHSFKKIKEGRFRLISAVSMVDSMIDRMLFGELADNVLASVGKTPIRIGWTPMLGGYRELRDLLPGKVVCIDKSSWDWTVPFWMTQSWLDIVLGLSNNHPQWWQVAVQQRFKALFEAPYFRFDDGTRVRQAQPGIMKSGCFLTIILNSVGQLLLHYMINAKIGLPMRENEPQCMGDDTAQRDFPELRKYLECVGELGFVVKEAKILDWIEFAGFMIDDRTWPVYWDKHAFKLMHTPMEELKEVLVSYQLLYAQEPVMSKYVRELMLKVCPKSIVPRSILTSFVSGSAKLAREWFKYQQN